MIRIKDNLMQEEHKVPFDSSVILRAVQVVAAGVSGKHCDDELFTTRTVQARDVLNARATTTRAGAGCPTPAIITRRRTTLLCSSAITNSERSRFCRQLAHFRFVPFHGLSAKMCTASFEY